MNKILPLYKAKIRDDVDGIQIISLVDEPAVESDFVAFASDKEPVSFKVEDEEKRLIKGVVLRADYPIYRRSGDYEYNVVFEADTIRQMAEKFLKDGNQNNVDTDHNLHLVDGVHMQEFFIKDTENGVSPKGFEDVADGSLFAVYKVDNDLVWSDIKEGQFNGFSMYGYLSYEEAFSKEDDKDEQEVLELINKIKNKLK